MPVARTKAFGGEVIPYDRVKEDREVIAAAGELRLIAAMNVAATYVDVAAATQRGSDWDSATVTPARRSTCCTA